MSVRRLIALLVLVGLGAMVRGMPAYAQDSILVRVGGDLAARAFNFLEVPVTVDLTGAPGRKLGGYRLTLRTNQTFLQFYDVTSWGFAQPQTQSDTSGVQIAALLPAGASGVVNLFTARLFVLVDTASTPITVQVREMTAAQGSSTPFEDLTPLVRVVNGTFCRSLGRWGDVDGDGTSGSRDALVALSYVVGLPIDTLMRPQLADVDSDGRVTSRDALIMLSYAVGLPVQGYRVLLTAAGACATGAAATLAVSPDTLELTPGQQGRVALIARDASGRAVATTGVVWRVADGNVAGWDDYQQAVIGRSPGTTRVTAELGPGVRDSLVVTVIPRRPNWYVDVRRAKNVLTQTGTQRYPMEFIGDAVNQARSGDTIRVAGGIYEETVTGIPNLVIIGDSLDRPVVDPRAIWGPYPPAFAMELGDPSGDLTVLHLVFRGRGLKSLAHNANMRNLLFEFQSGYQAVVWAESRQNPTAPTAPFPGSLGNVLISDVVIATAASGIYVPSADTVIVRNSTITGPVVSQGACESGETGIEIGGAYYVSRDASYVDIHDNVLSPVPCTGISVIAPSARAVLARNRIDASVEGIGASARAVTTSHNVVSMRVSYPYTGAYGVRVGSAFPADTLRSTGDSVRAPGTVYYGGPYGLKVDTALVAIVDSLVADSVGMDSVYTQFGSAVYLGGGRYLLTNSRIRNSGQYGVQFVGGRGSSLTSRRNRIEQTGSMAFTALSYYGRADSVTSVGDTVLRTRAGGFEMFRVGRARIDSALVDSTGFGAGAVLFTSVPRAALTNSTLRRAYLGVQASADTLLVGRNTIRRDTTAVLLLAPPNPLIADSARIIGNQLDSNQLNGLEVQGGLFAADSNTMVGSVGAGVYVTGGGRGRVTRSRLEGNATGAHISTGGGTLVVSNSVIQGNTLSGALNDAALTDTLDARNNYWGSANGPSCDILVTGVACSPAGGDSITSSRVLFTPFLGSAPVTPAPPAGVPVPIRAATPGSFHTTPVQIRPADRVAVREAPQPVRRAEPTLGPLPPSLRKGHAPRPPAGVSAQPQRQ